MLQIPSKVINLKKHSSSSLSKRRARPYILVQLSSAQLPGISYHVLLRTEQRRDTPYRPSLFTNHYQIQLPPVHTLTQSSPMPPQKHIQSSSKELPKFQTQNPNSIPPAIYLVSTVTVGCIYPLSTSSRHKPDDLESKVESGPR